MSGATPDTPRPTTAPSSGTHGALDPGEAVLIVYGDSLSSYDLSEDHPLKPSRHALTMSLLRGLGWLDDPGITIEEPRPVTLTELLAVHSYAYIEAVQNAQAAVRRGERATDVRVYGLGTDDVPLFAHIHDAAALHTGATIQAMEAVLEGRAIHAYSPAGGMHHAMRARAAGFCVYNDCAVAIAAALKMGRTVAYVDFDAHHGDGVQAAFYEEPRVLTVSVHESGRFLFPGTGFADETGAGEAKGTSLNVALPATAGNGAILAAYERIVAPAVRAFVPDVVVTQTGCDTHHADPLTDLTATLALYPELAARLHALVHQTCEGRWLIVGGGGYDPADVTPRAWAAFMGTVLGHDVHDVALPAAWIRASRAAGGAPPARLLDDTSPPVTGSTDHSVARALDEAEDMALAALLARSPEG
jgi:acetoin utilization protein AcuC